ncbi:abscisic acid 8'-hydroxylase 4 [Neltuma alba]|uniref:abscisic acid 8'-hydroxylase 4 n=1 Tax=Neltuma alba TaxID=207710 RepID=UPI0010A51B49|nr:abscisic acid 8'-hydroxylase 4 [Prosopis alba]
MATFVYMILFFLLLILCCLFIKKHKKPKGTPTLPPGSMGWPYIGETPQLYSEDPNVFFALKQKRYGAIFKTHVLGCPSVMLASPEAARFVLVTHAHLFKPTYPKSKEMLIGPSALFFYQEDYHARIRRLVQTSLSPERVRKLTPYIEAEAVSTLKSWISAGQVINVFQSMKKFSFNIGILSVFGYLEGNYKEQLKENYCIVERGYNSFPNRIPGTTYSRAFSARRRIQEIIREIIYKRKEKRLMEDDLLGHLLSYKDEKGQTLTDDQIADNLVGVLFAAQDTTASVLTWILKYLHDHPKLLEAIKEEQMAIHEANDGGKKPLTWGQTRTMPLTYRVILESLRMASIISFTYREATVDVVYNGYLIPKGWKVMPLFRNIHHNPEYFLDPHNFDPSRFQVAPKPNTFMPFGKGVHSCPGNELAKLNMLILIHHLVTKLRWEVVGCQGGVHYNPFPVPLHGLPARFWMSP